MCIFIQRMKDFSICITMDCWKLVRGDLFQDIEEEEQSVITYPGKCSLYVGKLFNFCREECDNYLVRTPVEIGGFDDTGQPVIVEVDESKYFHRKYHRGRWSKGHWVFGAIERGSGKCVIHLVHDRTAQTLEPLILQHVLPGSHIVSDGWRAYHNLSRLQNGIYQHSVVVHERHFVDPVYPEVHTNNIENLWMRAKRKLRRQFGTYRQLFPSYLREFEYRSLVNDDDIFSHYLTVLAENYA